MTYRFTNHALFGALSGTFLTLTLAAQTPRSTEQTPDRSVQDRTVQTIQDKTKVTTASTSDGILAAWLVAGNESEIALARLAEQRSQNAEVKEFARKMVQDHEQFLTKLKPFASAPGLVGRAVNAEVPDKTTEDPPDRAQDRPEGEQRAARPLTETAKAHNPISSSMDHVALIRDLAKECQDSAKRDLDQKQGAEFDRCYMLMSVGAHKATLSMLKVFRSYASEQFRPALAEGQSTVQMHLDHAMKLAKSLESPVRGDMDRHPEKSGSDRK